MSEFIRVTTVIDGTSIGARMHDIVLVYGCVIPWKTPPEKGSRILFAGHGEKFTLRPLPDRQGSNQNWAEWEPSSGELVSEPVEQIVRNGAARFIEVSPYRPPEPAEPGPFFVNLAQVTSIVPSSPPAVDAAGRDGSEGPTILELNRFYSQEQGELIRDMLMVDESLDELLRRGAL